MRVVLVTRIPQVVLGFTATLQSLDHEVVGLLTTVDVEQMGPLLAAVPAGADVVMPVKRSSLAPLLEPFAPDLVLCMGFPWKIPADALAVPKVGWLNGHPALLPRHRGPVPVAWAIRGGDPEVGVTFHLMDAELDTGPILSQQSMPLGEFTEPEEFYGRMGEIIGSALHEALAKIAAGERGEPQPDGGEYESFFGEGDVWLDLTRPAVEVHRLIWAWRYTFPVGTERGPLLELDGEVVRVLQSSLEPVDDATSVACADAPLWLVKTEPRGDQPSA